MQSRTFDVAGYRFELLRAAAYEASFNVTHDVLGFAFESQSGHHAFSSDRIRPFRTKPNSLAFTPRGCNVFSVSPGGGEYLRILRLDGGDTAQQFSDRIDPLAIQYAERVRGELLGNALSPLLMEEHAIALFERVGMDAHSSLKIGGCMTPSRLERIDELIDTNIGHRISIQEMARLLGLSEGFFIRAFKAATGKSPHGYLMDRQIAYARQLMQGKHHDLRDVALAAGFASHAHMTAVFRKRLGVRPSQFDEV